MNWILIGKALALLFVFAGGIIVYIAPKIVRKYDLAKRVSLTEDQERSLDEEGKRSYRFVQATLKVKLYGLLLASPGFVLVFVLFN